MIETITAVYEKGLLRPLNPLKLNEHQLVQLQVLISEESSQAAEEAAIRQLIATGILTPPSGCSEVEPISDEKRYELAEVIGRAPGRPLSEIIMEERGDR